MPPKLREKIDAIFYPVFMFTVATIGVVTFVGCWVYAVQAWGWFLGLAFGWIPALIFAVLAAYFLPGLTLACIAIGIIGIVGWLLWHYLLSVLWHYSKVTLPVALTIWGAAFLVSVARSLPPPSAWRWLKYFRGVRE